MTPRFRRYLLWQAPGWVAVGAALLALSGLTDLPLWIVPLGVAAFVTKDMVMYRVVRAHAGAARARGWSAPAAARSSGWRRSATCGSTASCGGRRRAGAEIEAGAPIVVREASGLTLRVDPAGPA